MAPITHTAAATPHTTESEDVELCTLSVRVPRSLRTGARMRALQKDETLADMVTRLLTVEVNRQD